MSRPLLLLCLLACGTFLAGLGRQAVTDADEAYYAEAAREMLESGDWLTPHFNYTDRWEKPVLYYWLTAATYRVAGVGEGAARLWSALAGFGLVWLTWAMAGPRRDPRAAWLGGAIAATSFGYASMARQALPDLPLAFCITLGTWAALRATDASRQRPSYGWWGLAGLGAGLGFLLKGPVALVVPGVILLPIWWLERRDGLPSPAGLAAAAFVAGAVGTPWYVAMWLTHGAPYLESFFIGDNLERFATSRFNDARSVLFYVPIVLGGLLPWTPFAATLWRPALQDQPEGPREARRLWLWALMPLLFFSLSVGKQPRYILPVLPALAVLLARALQARIRRSDRRADRVLAGGAGALALLLAGAGGLLVRARALFVDTLPGATLLSALVLFALAGWLVWIASTRAWSRIAAATSASGVALCLALQFGVLAGGRPEPVERIAAVVRGARHREERVGHFGVFTRNLVFYTGVAQVALFDRAQAASFLQSADRVLLVTEKRHVDALARDTGLRLEVLGEVDYLNAANVRLRTLLTPSPETNLVTAVVVANR